MPADGLPETNAHFEQVAWWYTRKKIGRSLAEHYELADDLPLRLVALIEEIDGKFKTSVSSVYKPPAQSRAKWNTGAIAVPLAHLRDNPESNNQFLYFRRVEVPLPVGTPG